MSTKHLPIDPRESYTAKIFWTLMAVSFVFMSLVGFGSNYFYQKILEEEKNQKAQEGTVAYKQELQSIFKYIQDAQTGLLGSSLVQSGVLNNQQEELRKRLQGFRFYQINFYSMGGTPLFLFERTREKELKIKNSDSVQKLNFDLLQEVKNSTKKLSVEDFGELILLRNYRYVKIGEKSIVSEVALSINKKFFQKISNNLKAYFLIQKIESPSFIFSYPIELGQALTGKGLDQEEVYFQGLSYRIIEDSLKVNDEYVEFYGLVDVDRLNQSLSKLHTRIFLIVLGLFLILSPLLYWIAIRLSNSLRALNERIERFQDGSNTNLLPVGRNDEIGSLTQKFNLLLDQINEQNQDVEARVLENVLNRQKLKTLESDYSHLIRDYLVSRIFRRMIDKVITEANYSQSFSNEAQKLFSQTNNSLQRLEGLPEIRAEIRREDLFSRLNSLNSTASSLSTRSLKNSESLIELLWFMDSKEKAGMESAFQMSLHMTRIMNKLFPHIKISTENLEELNIKDANQSFLLLLMSICFYASKKCRDGNHLEIQLKDAKDKSFNELQVLQFKFELPINFELSDQDFEGKQLLKMIEICSKDLSWILSFPNRSREKVTSFHIQI
ncbi:MAG: HAMP domain-containing protein [Bdellovibrionota bacterium]|nr:HAMP domain-containing protein [Bdellovibrionota bacterium]